MLFTRSGIARTDRFQHRTIGQIEKTGGLQVRIRMRTPHESVADNPNIQVFLLRHSCSSPRFSPTRAHRALRIKVAKNLHPGLGRGHHRVGEHAAVPADMFDRPESEFHSSSRIHRPAILTISILPLGSFGRAMAAGLVVRARAFDRAVVLRDVEINRPRTQCIGDLPQRVDQNAAIRPVDSPAGSRPALGRVVAQRIEHGVRHVRLKAKRLGAIRPVPEAPPCASSHAFRPSRFRLRRQAVRRSLRQWCTPRETCLRFASCFRPDFQPMLRGSQRSRSAQLRTCECRGLEASCRWRRPCEPG